jgi:hypothetical protein
LFCAGVDHVSEEDFFEGVRGVWSRTQPELVEERRGFGGNREKTLAGSAQGASLATS